MPSWYPVPSRCAWWMVARSPWHPFLACCGDPVGVVQPRACSARCSSTRGSDQRCEGRGAREERAEQSARWSATDSAQKVICVFRVAQLAQLQPGAVGKGEPEGGEPARLARVTLDAGLLEGELRDHLKVVGFGR